MKVPIASAVTVTVDLVPCRSQLASRRTEDPSALIAIDSLTNIGSPPGRQVFLCRPEGTNVAALHRTSGRLKTCLIQSDLSISATMFPRT